MEVFDREIDIPKSCDNTDFEEINIPHYEIKNIIVLIINEKESLHFLLKYIRADIDELLITSDGFIQKITQVQKFYLESTPEQNQHGRTLGNYTESVGAIFLLMFNLDLYILEERNEDIIFDLMQYFMTSCNLYKNKLPIDMISPFIIPNRDGTFITVPEYMLQHLLTRTPRQQTNCAISNKYNKYETKYLKYKQKYIRLKKLSMNNK